MKKVMMTLAVAGLLTSCAQNERDSVGATSGGTTSGTGSGTFPSGGSETDVIRSDSTDLGSGGTGVDIPARTNRVDW